MRQHLAARGVTLAVTHDGTYLVSYKGNTASHGSLRAAHMAGLKMNEPAINQRKRAFMAAQTSMIAKGA